MEANVINLTPHPINIFDKAKRALLASIPPSGMVARINSKSHRLGTVNGFELVKADLTEVNDLPEPVEGTYYVVSAIIGQQFPSRKDLICSDTSGEGVVKNQYGKVIGCTQFQTFYEGVEAYAKV